jgi:uncharacterized membrane protein YhhN
MRASEGGGAMIFLIFLILFGLFSFVHLGAAFFAKDSVRRFTKLFLVPLLLLYYVSRTDNRLWQVVFALIFGWIGDVFLVKTNRQKYLKCGLIFFLLGHLSYIFAFACFISSVDLRVIPPALVVSLLLALVTYRFDKPPRKFLPAAAIYYFTLEALNVCVFMLLLANRSVVSLIAFAGAFLFLVSDTILGYFNFTAHSRRSHFYIMLPYLAAQFMLVISLTRLGG